MEHGISIKGAREHNLKNISLNLPRHKLIVITGLSGSGKSSLAFDTIYAEGQRRYLESLSSYARQFLEQLKKPDVDYIEGLSPSISIEQKYISRNPRSTVGTVTEIYDFLRLLFSRVGSPHCVICGKPIHSQSVQQIVEHIMNDAEGTKFAILSPIVRGKKGEYQKELSELRSRGFLRARIDGEDINLSNPFKLSKNQKHDISIYVDRLILKHGINLRLAEAVEMATKLSDGIVEIDYYKSKGNRYFSTRFACVDCGTSFPEIEPRNFSFNSPHGACETCNGLGGLRNFDPNLIISNADLSLQQAIIPFQGKTESWKKSVFEALSEKYGFEISTPFKSLPESVKHILFFGSGRETVSFKTSGKKGSQIFCQKFPGIIALLKQFWDSASSKEKESLEPFLGFQKCPSCNGSRLKKEMTHIYFQGKNIAEICDFNIIRCHDFLYGSKLSKNEEIISGPILKEILSRLEFLINVGLGYLTLSRTAATLSGGEAQRVRLATQIGSNLIGVLYVLDEPSIGLHQRDNDRLINTLKKLRDLGNTVIVVEHDRETIEQADHVVDLGPQGGMNGGHLVFEGSPQKIRLFERSLTGQYLSGKLKIPILNKRAVPDNQKYLVVHGATTNNLKNISIKFPLGTFICVTGVSGSGKSSLIIDTLLPALESSLSESKAKLQNPVNIGGLEHINKVIHVDQSPIGRTPRSNPATYTGLFSDIRILFSTLPESRARGYSPSRFSFNVGGGRCEACSGDGTIKISMHFLPDVFIECEVCQGRRYNRETLEVLYRGKNIADVLSMTIQDSFQFFERIPSLKSKLKTLLDVGMGYVTLGQSAVTLSGGEAQRIKLARELSRKATGKTIYILDEPTTGLHFEDVNNLLVVLQTLVDQGNTVIVIEHNLDVIKQADYLIDLGPEGGEDGGFVLFEGSPEILISKHHTATGEYLKKVF